MYSVNTATQKEGFCGFKTCFKTSLCFISPSVHDVVVYVYNDMYTFYFLRKWNEPSPSQKKVIFSNTKSLRGTQILTSPFRFISCIGKIIFNIIVPHWPIVKDNKADAYELKRKMRSFHFQKIPSKLKYNT